MVRFTCQGSLSLVEHVGSRRQKNAKFRIDWVGVSVRHSKVMPTLVANIVHENELVCRRRNA